MSALQQSFSPTYQTQLNPQPVESFIEERSSYNLSKDIVTDCSRLILNSSTETATTKKLTEKRLVSLHVQSLPPVERLIPAPVSGGSPPPFGGGTPLESEARPCRREEVPFERFLEESRKSEAQPYGRGEFLAQCLEGIARMVAHATLSFFKSIGEFVTGNSSNISAEKHLVIARDQKNALKCSIKGLLNPENATNIMNDYSPNKPTWGTEYLGTRRFKFIGNYDRFYHTWEVDTNGKPNHELELKELTKKQ